MLTLYAKFVNNFFIKNNFSMKTFATTYGMHCKMHFRQSALPKTYQHIIKCNGCFLHRIYDTPVSGEMQVLFFILFGDACQEVEQKKCRRKNFTAIIFACRYRLCYMRRYLKMKETNKRERSSQKSQTNQTERTEKSSTRKSERSQKNQRSQDFEDCDK